MCVVCMEVPVARLLRAARVVLREPKHAAAQAHTLAHSRGDSRVSIFHLFHVLAEESWMRSGLRRAGLDDDEVLARTLAHLDDETEVDDLLGDAVERLPNLSQVVAVALRRRSVESMFEQLGCTTADFLRALVRSSVGSDDDTLPGDGDSDVDVLFHDDDFTTMDCVVEILSDCFAIPQHFAIATMTRVHKTGSSVVKTCPASEARWRIEKGRAQALQAGMPLRISWRAHRRSSEPDHDDRMR